MICMAALLVMAMSCKKNEEGTNADGKGFRASMEAQTGDSKTHLEGSSVKWDSDDAIRVVNGATPAAWFDFTTNAVVGQDGCVVFEPSGQGFDARFFQPNYTAYYPAGIYNHATGKVTLPDTQTYAKVNSYDSFGNGSNPMVAKSEDERLNFKHLCGILALSLKGTCTVASIKLTALNNNVKLWGEGTVNYSGDEPVLTLDGNTRTDANSITMNCGENGVTLSTTAATRFYFVIPAGVDLGGISVELTDKAGNVWNHSTPTMEMSIPRKTLASMAEIAVETHNPNFPIGAIPGWFTVDLNGTSYTTADDKKVCFSRGNLQYQASTDTWRFAEHQYDFVGGTYGNKQIGNVYYDGVKCDNTLIGADYNGWIDLFGWGTSGNNNKFPYMTSMTDSEYGDGNKDISGTNYDWGVYNAISNGGNTPNTWRTLNGKGYYTGEWHCILFERQNCNDLWAYGRITTSDSPSTWYSLDDENNIGGLILLPDNWNDVKPVDIDFQPGAGSGSFSANTYSTEQWAKMEAAGAVFLPYSFYRNGNALIEGGSYWSSSKDYLNSYNTNATALAIYSNTTNPNGNVPVPRHDGFSVRLVKDKPKP